MSRAWLVVAVALLATLAGCARREARHARTVPDTTGTSGRYAPGLILSDRAGARLDPARARELRPALTAWERAWSRQDPGFRLDSLVWGPAEALRADAPQPLHGAFFDGPERRALEWVFAPGGGRAVVPDIYREWNVDESAWAYDADAAIALVDLRAGRWTRLGMCGTSCRYDVAAWLGPERFVVAGILTDGIPQQAAPSVSIFDLERRTVTHAVGPIAPWDDMRYDDALDSLMLAASRTPA